MASKTQEIMREREREGDRAKKSLKSESKSWFVNAMTGVSVTDDFASEKSTYKKKRYFIQRFLHSL